MNYPPKKKKEKSSLPLLQSSIFIVYPYRSDKLTRINKSE